LWVTGKGRLPINPENQYCPTIIVIHFQKKHMKLTLDKQEKYVLLHLNETKLDATISPALKAEMITLNGEGHRNFILDLEAVKYIDSSGLSAILVTNRLCNEAGGVLVLCRLTDHVLKLIRISQLDSILEILPTVHESVEAVFMNDLEKDLGKS
jgi:anti-sigma B factor antagonist